MELQTEEEQWEELKNFHWDPSRLDPQIPTSKPLKGIWYNYVNKHKESWSERVARMLLSMEGTVKQCSMCHLGRQMCTEPRGNREITFDPHVFSNRKPSKWMIVGQNPGVNECLDNEPFVGAAGQFFNYQLEANGLERDDFYISNTVKCHTLQNKKPDHYEVQSCRPILMMELGLLKPKLVITLGAVAFGIFCPGKIYGDSLGKIVKSDEFNVNIFPVYHPSPLNMRDQSRKSQFEEDMKLLCRLVLAHRAKHA